MVAMPAWRRGGGVVVDGEPVAAMAWHSEASRRSPPSLSISLGFEVGNGGGGDESRTTSCQFLPPLYRATRRGPTSLFLGWAPLIRVRVKGPDMAVGPSLVEINLTFSPLISSYTFNFISFTYFHISSQIMHRAISSSRSVANRFNSYNTSLCSKIDSLTLGPLSSGKHRLYHKPMSTVCSLYTLGGKPLVSGSATTFCHLNSQSISIMIPDFLLYNV